MKNDFKKLGKFITSKMLYILLGVLISLSIFAARAAWDSYVGSGQTLTPTLWNDVVDKLIELDNSVAILTGTVANGETIPLPAGYTQDQCKWFVSMNSTDNLNFDIGSSVRFQCYADVNRVVTCRVYDITSNWRTATANYIIIGIK
jgi:hypothetical protein